MSQALASREQAADSGLRDQLDRWYGQVRMRRTHGENDRMDAYAIIALVRAHGDGPYYSRPLGQAYDQFERQLLRGITGRDALERARMALLCAIDMARSNLG